MTINETQVDAALENMDASEMANVLKRVLEILYCEKGQTDKFDDSTEWTADTASEIADALAVEGLSPESIGTKGGERV
jgi:hypothetical protein